MNEPNKKWAMTQHKDWVYYAIEGWAHLETAAVKVIKLVGWGMEKRLTRFANLTGEDEE
jgi:hypothetical protein